MRVCSHLYTQLFKFMLKTKPMKRCLSKDATEIFQRAVDSVLPHQMIRRSLDVNGSRLLVNGNSYYLNHNVHLVGFGKAVIGMATAVEEILGHHLVKGVVSVPYGIQESLKSSGQTEFLLKEDSAVKVLEGAVDNLPDEFAMQAAKEIASLAEIVGKDDILIVLVSGGGSALLPLPVPTITLEEKLQVTKTLAREGATIQELNTVRKMLSRLKGGRLAQLAKPAKVITLILSDIIGDPLDLIASGPTVENTTTATDALAIISRFGGESLMPQSAMVTLKEAAAKQEIEKDGGAKVEEDFCHVQNVIVGSNKIALEKSCEKAEDLGYHSLIMSSGIYGDARRLAEAYCNLSTLIGLLILHRERLSACEEIISKLKDTVKLMSEFGVCEMLSQHIMDYINAPSGAPLCLIAGGETTVTLRGNGKGGRNQELALAAATYWQKIEALNCNMRSQIETLDEPDCQMFLLSAGTDGQDGPTDAAGAVSHPLLVNEAIQMNLNPDVFLDNNDSYSFYSALKNGTYLLKTGLTGTNVMDIHIILIKPKLIAALL